MNLLKRLYFDIMSNLIRIIAISTGWIHGPWTRKKIKQINIIRAKQLLKVGDIILTHTRGEFTTITIPGYWKHLEIFIGDGKTIGAVAPKVREGYLEDLLHHTDYFAIVRMNDMTEEEGRTIAEHAISRIGTPYDMRMQFKRPDKVSCSELGFNSVNKARQAYLELRLRLGFETCTPQDFYDAKSKFTIIYEKRGK